MLCSHPSHEMHEYEAGLFVKGTLDTDHRGQCELPATKWLASRHHQSSVVPHTHFWEPVWVCPGHVKQEFVNKDSIVYVVLFLIMNLFILYRHGFHYERQVV